MSECTFEGFEQANTTPVPDILFDQLLTELSGAEIKVVLYIIRRTAGFKKNTDAISFNQFLNGITTREGKVLDKGCGIKDRTTLSKTLASLEKKKCIKASKGNDPHGDKATTTYSIFLKEVVGKSYHPVPMGSREIIPPVVGNPYHGSREIILGVVGKSYLQETVIQQTELQDTDKQEDTYVDDRSRDIDAHTPSENKSHYQHSEGSSQQDIHTEPQASDNYLIANPTPQTDALVDVPIGNAPSLVEVEPQAAAPTRKRKPKVTKPEDEGMKKRIDAVLDCLDELGTEYAGEEFHYSRFKTDKEAVETLLTSWTKLTREQVIDTYRSMMDSPRSKSGFLWSEHMSVKAFCNNFAAEFARMKGNSNGHANKETNNTSAAVAAGYTDYTNTPPTNYKPLPRKRA